MVGICVEQLDKLQVEYLIKPHHVENGGFLFPTSHLTVKIDERKRFTSVVSNFIIVVELNENLEVEFFIRFELDGAWKYCTMFTICYLDEV